MTNTEKIANAKKRIDELERLIKYWNNLEYDEQKIVDFSMKIENNVAQILMIQVKLNFYEFRVIFYLSIYNIIFI